VLVAMVILATSLSVLLRIFSVGLRNISVSEDYATAILIAEARLNSAGALTALAPSSTAGVVEQRFRWTQTIEDYRPYANFESTVVPIDTYSVTVAVEWPHANSVRRVSLSSIKLAEARRRKP